MNERINELHEKVYSKLNEDYENLKKKFMEYDKEDLIKFENAYELIVKEEIMASFDQETYDEVEYKALLKKDNLLDFLYKDWKNSDYGIHIPISENLQEFIIVLRDDYERFENDPNSKLILDMTETFKQLNNYSFCDKFIENYKGLEDKYQLRNFFNSKDGIKRLLEFFKDIKDNEQLNYLKEIQVINTESIDKITDEYIPKLNEIINKNKNKSKDMER